MPLRPSHPLLLIMLACLLWAAWPQAAQAQVKRCVGADGDMIYTDKDCRSIGATDRLMRPSGNTFSGAAYRGGCSRDLNDLMYGLSSAIWSGDVNRLALFYDWTGMSTRNGYAVMSRLRDISRRTLVDVYPVYPKPPPILAEDGTVLDDNADGFYPQTTTRQRAPVAIRLEQTLRDGNTPSRTTFGLRKRLGCWWVRL